MFIAALITIAKLWKQSRCPTTENIVLKELSQMQKDKGCMFSFIYGR
jgi:hypothetical protein